MLGACIEPLQGLESKVDTWTHLLKEKKTFLTPILNYFIFGTSREKLKEANVSNFFEVNVHLHRGAKHQAVVTMIQPIQTEINVF